jgi:phospholipid/cholesterol/gamma-HCH transport system permease protein
MPILQPIGRTVLAFLETVGRLSLFTAISTSHCMRPPFYPRLLLRA